MRILRTMRTAIGAAGLAASLAAGLTATALSQQSAAPAPELPPLSDIPAAQERPDDHVMGAEDAPVLMIEYASFACPHCAHFQEDVWPVIRDEFVETGQVRYVLRPMLTAPPQLAAAGVILAECAAEDRYFDAADLLFAEQAAIFQAAQSGGDVLGVYNRVAAAVGVSPEQLMACFNDPATNAAVNNAARQAQADGVQSTPSFFISGKHLTIAAADGGTWYMWGGDPLIINGERVPGQIDEDSFRRIILHFLDAAE